MDELAKLKFKIWFKLFLLMEIVENICDTNQ